MTCIGCCVRLVRSARREPLQQEGLLAAIARNKKAPSRENIIEAMKA